MTKKINITEEQIKKMYDMHKEGKTIVEIAKELKYSKDYIRRMLIKHTEYVVVPIKKRIDIEESPNLTNKEIYSIIKSTYKVGSIVKLSNVEDPRTKTLYLVKEIYPRSVLLNRLENVEGKLIETGMIGNYCPSHNELYIKLQRDIKIDVA